MIDALAKSLGQSLFGGNVVLAETKKVDDGELEKGGPGSGPHPGHAAAGEKSAAARASSVIAGNSTSNNKAVIAHHTAAMHAHFSAADHYQRLADAHKEAGQRHRDFAMRQKLRTPLKGNQ